MIIVSKFSSLWLGRREEWTAPHDRDTAYIQEYAIGDALRIQFIGWAISYTAKYSDTDGNDTPIPVTMLYTDGYGKSLFEMVFTVDDAGAYELCIDSDIDTVYSYFCIKPKKELKNTILLQYTHRRNEYDTIFVNGDSTKNWFNFRVEGGIYPGDKTQTVDNETFRDQRFISFQTSAESYEVSILIAGTKAGVPQWVGNRINNIFKLSDVLVDGIETKRNEASVPELVQLGTYYPLYVFKLNIEQSDEERVWTIDEGGADEFLENLIITHDGTPIVTQDGYYLLTAG